MKFKKTATSEKEQNNRRRTSHIQTWKKPYSERKTYQQKMVRNIMSIKQTNVYYIYILAMYVWATWIER